MSYRVIVLPRAECDIRDAARWILEQSRSAAKAVRWMRSIQTKIAQLQTNPKRCPIDSDSAAYGEDVRVLLYGKRRGIYRILFTIRGEDVYVLTVRHSARRSVAEEGGEGESETAGFD